MNKKIILFGSTGMLGKYVYKVLKHIFNVTIVNRDSYDILNNDEEKLFSIIENISPCIIINCCVLIPQRNNTSNKDYILINTLFPIMLNKICIKNNIKFIHITTDCVFSGKKGNYIETDTHDTEDMYGISKSLAESMIKEATIIRTSIIGEEEYHKKSLLEWVRSNEGCTITGYKNVIWNGVTCLTLAQIIETIIITNNFWNGVRHIHGEKISKYDLIKLIIEIYNLNIIMDNNEDYRKDMSMDSLFNFIDVKNIKDQLIDMKNFK